MATLVTALVIIVYSAPTTRACQPTAHPNAAENLLHSIITIIINIIYIIASPRYTYIHYSKMHENAPEMISEGLKSKIFLRRHAPRPP